MSTSRPPGRRPSTQAATPASPAPQDKHPAAAESPTAREAREQHSRATWQRRWQARGQARGQARQAAATVPPGEPPGEAPTPPAAPQLPAVPPFVLALQPQLEALLAPLQGQATMLDAACGLGRGLAACGGWCSTAHAVDASAEAIALARRLWEAPGAPQPQLRIHWQTADLLQASLPQGAFDLLCTFSYTDHAFFPRLQALLKPGGLWLHQGFSPRMRTLKPSLPTAWTLDAAGLKHHFPHWRILFRQETTAPPFLLRAALQAP